MICLEEKVSKSQEKQILNIPVRLPHDLLWGGYLYHFGVKSILTGAFASPKKASILRKGSRLPCLSGKRQDVLADSLPGFLRKAWEEHMWLPKNPRGICPIPILGAYVNTSTMIQLLEGSSSPRSLAKALPPRSTGTRFKGKSLPSNVDMVFFTARASSFIKFI